MSNPDFRPAWWLPGPHAQTIGARLLRSRRGVTFRRERLSTEDGDFLDLDWVVRAGAWEPDERTPLVLLLHGLEGSARSDYALEAYRALARAGMAAVGLNFRGCSGDINRLPRMYHSGETGDLTFVARQIAERAPSRRLGAVGFSLGGNVLLKYLGERGAGSGERGAGEDGSPFAAAVAISVPFDLAAGATHLARGSARFYQWFLMRKLLRKLAAKSDVVHPHLDLARALAARTFWEFDDAATAPLHGFASAAEYYEQSSSARFLATISVPTLLIHSLDDPFIPCEAVPRADASRNGTIESAFTVRGGHVGFVTGPPWAPRFWAEQTAATYLAGKLGTRTESPRAADDDGPR